MPHKRRLPPSSLRKGGACDSRVCIACVKGTLTQARHTAAVLDCGAVFVWGWNHCAQLGTGSSAGIHTPTMLKAPPELRYANDIAHVCCGPLSTAVWS